MWHVGVMGGTVPPEHLGAWYAAGCSLLPDRDTGAHVFLAAERGNRGEELPQFTLDATNELKPYFEKFKQTPEETSGQALELIVFTWLSDLAQSGELRTKQDSSLRWLAESGLLKALGKSRIELGAVQ